MVFQGHFNGNGAKHGVGEHILIPQLKYKCIGVGGDHPCRLPTSYAFAIWQTSL